VEETYRKDMSHTTWGQVFERQGRRADLIREWMDDLQLRPGARVLDLGAGPGYASLLLAERVGPDGCVYAVDRSAEALAFLEGVQRERGLAQIQRILIDGAALESEVIRPEAALVAMVLHHVDDPSAVLAAVARVLPPHGLAVVAEFHPEGPCEHGPPRTERLMPDRVRSWCEETGFDILAYRRQTPEHYAFVVRRRF
jgi:ubiquinone/menaquinone biosynthesis C-methylase UbiE